jgi:hypothetical protein
LRIPDVKHAAAECAPSIDQQVGDAGLEVAGPWMFVSHNLPKEGRSYFDWAICLPVERPAQYQGPIELCRLAPIMVASTVHQGSLRSLFTKGYAPLLAELEMSRYVLSGESREIYHDWRGLGARYHRVEIQFGLSR